MLGPTGFYSQQFITVGVGATFSLLLATLWTVGSKKLLGPTFSPNKWEELNTNPTPIIMNCWEKIFVGTNSFGPTKGVKVYCLLHKWSLSWVIFVSGFGINTYSLHPGLVWTNILPTPGTTISSKILGYLKLAFKPWVAHDIHAQNPIIMPYIKIMGKRLIKASYLPHHRSRS